MLPMRTLRSAGGWGLVALALGAACATACASSAPPDVGLASRVDALEAEVRRLRAELDDQKLAHMTSGEMTDAQFERYVQQALAKTPPGEREQTERRLRSDRKLAQLGDDGLPRYWEERFAREATDEAWSSPAVRVLTTKVRQALGPRGSLIALACRSQLCRVEVEGDRNPEPGGAVMLSVGAPPPDEAYALFGGTQRGRHEETPGGRVHVVVFVARRGVDLIPE